MSERFFVNGHDRASSDAIEIRCATPRAGSRYADTFQPHGVIALSLIAGLSNPGLIERHRPSSTMPCRKWFTSEPHDDENAALWVLPR